MGNSMENIVQKEKRGFNLTTFHLRVIAIISMLIDHLMFGFNFGILNGIFEILGRLAFPIFAFQIAEGYCNTRDFKKYFNKVFIFAIISEVPFDIITGFGLIGPYHQNVLWTFLIGLFIIKIIDIFERNTENKFFLLIKSALVCIIGFFIGELAMVDYYGIGVLIVVMFYLTRNLKYKHIIQFVLLLFANIQLGGKIIFPFGANKFGISIQSFSLISLFLIWMYKGEQGYTSKKWRSFCYWFYPLHMIIIFLIFVLISFLKAY